MVLGRDQITLLPAGRAVPENVPLGGRSHAERLDDLRRGGELVPPVVLAIDPDLDFLITRGSRSAPLRATSLEHLDAQVEGGLVTATEATRVGRRSYSTLCAFPKHLVMQVAEVLGDLPRNQRSIVPATQALAALALRMGRAPRRWRTTFRLILGPERGLALLMVGERVLARRIFRSGPAGEAVAATAALRSLLAHAGDELELRLVDGLLLHAEPERAAPILAAAERMGLEVVLLPVLEFGAAAIAEAIRCHAGGRVKPPFELLQRAGDPADRLPSFPLVAVMPALLAILGSGGWLYHAGARVLTEADALAEEAAALTERTRTGAEVVSDRLDALRLEIGIASSFLARRAWWAGLLEELPALLPAAATLDAASGRYPLLLGTDSEDEEAVYGEGERFFRLECTVPVGEESSPPEVAALGVALKQSAAVQRNFPLVRGATVQLQTDQTPPRASVSVVCQPRGG